MKHPCHFFVHVLALITVATEEVHVMSDFNTGTVSQVIDEPFLAMW